MNIRDNIQPNSFLQGLDQPDGYGAFDEELFDRTETIGTRELNLCTISNIEFDDIDYADAPDFADAYIVSADMDGIPMSDEELDMLNENKGFVFEKLFDKLY